LFSLRYILLTWSFEHVAVELQSTKEMLACS